MLERVHIEWNGDKAAIADRGNLVSDYRHWLHEAIAHPRGAVILRPQVAERRAIV